MAAEHSEDIEMQEEDDINYENIETKTTAQETLQPGERETRLYRLVGVSVGLLFVAQALLNIGLRLPLYQLQSRFDELQTRYNNLIERDDIKSTLCESYGFTLGGDVCYYISTEEETWEQSRQYCRDRQSDLIVINSTEKQDLVDSLNQRVWLGLTDREEEGNWKWVDGTRLTTPKYWYPTQPDNYGHCAAFNNWSDTDIRGWHVKACHEYNNFICERVIY